MPTIPNAKQNTRQVFYCKETISIELSGNGRWRILQSDGQVLAQKNHSAVHLPTALAACDPQRSVLSMHNGERHESQIYSPYGHHSQGSGLLSLLAFNGERPDPATGHYHLGRGYRQFSPVMMRFSSPDSWSPFGAGGFNAYVYCAGDPTNRSDPTGHFWGIGTFFRRLFGMKPKAQKKKSTSLPVTKTNPTQGNRAVGAMPKAAPTGGDTIPFEKLFNDREIAEQFQLFENLNLPERSVVKKGNSRVQSLGSTPDNAAGERYERYMGVQRGEVNNYARTLELDALANELDQVNSRMERAGPSRDIMVQSVLQKEIRRRVS
ncbi:MULTISPECIES: RHS repeat-associated core domain-containing protein [Pseudomonas]|uniref:RHS repeat-associated core domain-containing protein n=1 Tax=Pseudomonas TaxID=286 RepID=UPI000EEA374B|nr:MULTISPECIES: RHS repeat-associated core domain-containing protein [Pseudomonas]MBG6126600.1 RHS repeat-associated protein [Pseudomonas sp. M2]HDS1746360.1 RHS repeat-associated core domain-containing protein [Pseudomonas putida]